MENSHEKIAHQIKRLRKKKDLTQKQLSSLCDYSRTYIGKIERGEKSPSLETLIRLADALNTDITELFSDNIKTNRNGTANTDTSTTRSVFSQYNYIVGVMRPDGSVKRMRRIPWSYRSERLEPSGRKLWNLGIVESIDRVENEIRSGIKNASLGESVYYHMKDSSNESNNYICDLAIHPLSEERGKVVELGFEYFWPSEFESNGQLNLTDTLFDSIEKVTGGDNQLPSE